MTTIKKGQIGEQDITRFDGSGANTFTRETSTGAELTITKFGYVVDVLATYGNCLSFTKTTLDSAISAIGTTTKTTILLRPGTWTITADSDYSTYKNITWDIMPGAVLSVAAGQTLTLYSPEHITSYSHAPIFAGSGNVIFTTGGLVHPDWWTENVTPGTTDMYSAIVAADSSMGSNYGTLSFTTGSYKSSLDITFDSKINLKFNNFSNIAPATSKTITINSPENIEAGIKQQIFAGAGSVSFATQGIVYPHWFGAKGDGTSDDSGAFNIMADSLSSGGTIKIPYGTYLLNQQVSFAQSTNMVGEGKQSILKLGTTITLPMLSFPANLSSITNLGIDGNVSGNTVINNALVELNGDQITISNIYMYDIRAIGITVGGDHTKILNNEIYGSNSASIDNIGVWHDNNVYDLLISGNTFKNHGINATFGKGYDVRIVNNYFANNHLQSVPTGGGQLCIARGAESVVIANNTVEAGGGVSTYGIEVEGTNIVVLGNVIRLQGMHGIVLQYGSNFVIANNYIENTQSQDGIYVAADITRFSITGNYCTDTQTPSTQTYGINVATGASDYYVIIGNTLLFNKTDGLNDGGTGIQKTIEHNTTY
ncbi:MAG: right-handed parallel beta-helix repeat-containing protein [Candidatus Omnitrophota bacterium]